MSTQHEISEYIDNLPLKKTFCRGFRPDAVYEVVLNISSMYNQILSDSFDEMEELKRRVEFLRGCLSEKTKKETEEQTMFRNMKEQDYDYKLINDVVEQNKEEERLSDKELQRLKRGELLEIMLEQSKENESLKMQLLEKDRQIEELKMKLDDRKIELSKAGTIAEASLLLNGVIEATEKAAEQYLDNLQDLCTREEMLWAQKEAEIEIQCTTLLQTTHERCAAMQEEAIQKCEMMESDMKKHCEELLAEAEQERKNREQHCQEGVQIPEEAVKEEPLAELKTGVDKRWEDLSKRLDDFYARMKIYVK